LTPEAIDRVLTDFRTWLEELVQEPAQADANASEEAIDLHTLLGQVTALRQELNLQTRAVRAQQEQNSEALRQLSQALAVMDRERAPDKMDAVKADAERPLLKALVDVYDALSLAGREARRVQETLASAFGNGAVPETGPQLSGLAGWLARGALRRYRQEHEQQWQRQREASDRVRELLDAMVAGYAMSLRRLERVLEQQNMESFKTVGQPFDPELMEAVEVVSGQNGGPGVVIDEIRRGYRWRGRVFRYAQVRVAK
jgi:molecular chaperone GrpE